MIEPSDQEKYEQAVRKFKRPERTNDSEAWKAMSPKGDVPVISLPPPTSEDEETAPAAAAPRSLVKPSVSAPR